MFGHGRVFGGWLVRPNKIRQAAKTCLVAKVLCRHLFVENGLDVLWILAVLSLNVFFSNLWYSLKTPTEVHPRKPHPNRFLDCLVSDGLVPFI